MPVFPVAARRGRELAVIMARLGVDQKWLFQQTKIAKGEISRICTGKGTTHKARADIITNALAAEYKRQFGKTGAPTTEDLFDVAYGPGQAPEAKHYDARAERAAAV